MVGRYSELSDARVLSKRVTLALVAVTIAATCWFFWRTWQSASTLATRTLPGIAYATEMLDRAANLEISRRGGSLDERGAASFRQSMEHYSRTIAIDQDRGNFEDVRRAYELYADNPDAESWQRLRNKIKTLHHFRQQRAQSFASDSKGNFAAALAVNAAGLVLFVLLLIVLSLFFALSRPHESRPDDF